MGNNKVYLKNFWRIIPDDLMKTVYCIYAKGKLIFENLSEKDFQQVWTGLNQLVSIYTDVEREDLRFEQKEIG